ncbi:sulfatase family protein [Algoriphagus resistens]|uniref:sulfatase family protein n=1 Tax=Algoriphagus resistens TaxID=1750590 RepID=UPI000716B7CE|nr:sulfatase [Algoriphagus resistens]
MKYIPLMIMAFLVGIAEAHCQKRPNIVLFIADDLGAIDIPLYGNQLVKTPNLDKLGSESLTFTNAFASSPTCSPSRASIHTGMMPFRNGAHANHTGIKENILTLPAYLRGEGYKVAIAGKYHLGPMEAYPFEMVHGTNVAEPGHEGDGVLWTDLIMDPVDDWLSDASEEADTPFMLVVNDHSPHVFWPESPEYNASEVQIPTIHIDTEETRTARSKYYTDITKMDRNVGRLMKILETRNLLTNTIFIFTSDQGPQWAFGKWSLYDYGIQVPLLVRWPGVIEEGRDTDALVSLVDLLPTIIAATNGNVPSEPSKIDGKSFLPLLLGKTDKHREYIVASHTGDGDMNRSPMRMIRTKRYKYILNIAPEVKYTTHMDKAHPNEGYWKTWVEKSYLDEHAKAVLQRYHNHPTEELYDMLADSDETNNLAFNPLYQEIVKDLKTRLSKWREDQGDREIGPFDQKGNNSLSPGGPYIFK